MPVTTSTTKLTRRFDKPITVDQLNLTITAGDIFGLSGLNAAGKSTSIRLLAGILLIVLPCSVFDAFVRRFPDYE